jgi:predicted glycosyltransferase
MSGAQTGARILIYSHDSFGLGHLRRCREIAHALVEAEPQLSVLILSGSPIIGSFDFHNRVDFVRIPGVIKLRDGEYVSLKLPLAIEQTIDLRASIIQHTADIYDPDLFLVDKEPLGLRGEVEPTLRLMAERGTPCVLGLRDVLDDPDLLAPEWERKNALPAIANYYDDLWVYGLPQICEPLSGLDVPRSVLKRLTYTGYLRRSGTDHAPPESFEPIDEPFILVTTGGGGDGEAIVDWVLRAYEQDPRIPYPAVVLLGPFMGTDLQSDFQRRVNQLDKVHAITFTAHVENLMQQALGVVCMGGYNTFCEVLSFDKRTLMIPRTQPRREQYIRAVRAQELGLVRVLTSEKLGDARIMATALRTLPQQPLPSVKVVPGLLDGRRNVVKLTRQWIARGRHARRPDAIRSSN